jgi:hypothetical protein
MLSENCDGKLSARAVLATFEGSVRLRGTEALAVLNTPIFLVLQLVCFNAVLNASFLKELAFRTA